MSIVQEIMLRSTNCLRRIIAPVGGQGGVTCLTCARIATVGGSLEESWQEGDAEQWEEEQHLEYIVERRRMEGNSLELDVMQKLPELVVTERTLREEHQRKKYQDGLLKK